MSKKIHEQHVGLDVYHMRRLTDVSQVNNVRTYDSIRASGPVGQVQIRASNCHGRQLDNQLRYRQREKVSIDQIQGCGVLTVQAVVVSRCDMWTHF